MSDAATSTFSICEPRPADLSSQARVRPPSNDLTGQKFGDWRVISFWGRDKHNRPYWRVRCEACNGRPCWACGRRSNFSKVLEQNLVHGRSKNCGCVRNEKLK